tara:strand:- start:2716 stop:3534 length:819 start_codon:yes stop_codon:yes gene_type:complete
MRSTSQNALIVRVRDRKVTEYNHNGNVYIEGRKGSYYEIYFENGSHKRVKIVPAVDGLSVLDGKPAGVNSPGYVVNARGNVSIPGWTLDNGKVAKFVFGASEKSYAYKSNTDPSNIGVIGVMVFEEQDYPAFILQTSSLYTPTYGVGMRGTSSGQWVSDSSIGSSITNSAIASSSTITNTDSDYAGIATASSSMSNEVGTIFGEETEFATKQTSFTAKDSNNPTDMLVMYYDSLKGLEKKGVQIQSRTRKKKGPEAFPTYVTVGCEPPADWK